MTGWIGLIALATGYGWLTAPAMRRSKARASFMGGMFAHRGLWDDATPENSLDAYQRAIQAGYGIECDVRVSADGQTVLFHDEDLQRMCGCAGRVETLQWSELSQMRLQGSASRMPRLREALDTVNGAVPLIIEIKMDVTANASRICEAVFRELDGYRGTYCIESFHPLALRWVRKHRPTVMRGQLIDANYRIDGVAGRVVCFLMRQMGFHCLSRPDFISCNVRARSAAFAVQRRVFHTDAAAWTVDSPALLKDARKRFDWFIFEGFDPIRTDG